MSDGNKHLDRLDGLRDDAIDVLENCMDDNDAEWKDRINAAKEVLNRTATTRDPLLGRDEISERLSMALQGLALAFLGNKEINVTPTVDMIMEGVDEKGKRKEEGEVYEGVVKVEKIAERKKYNK